MPVIHVPPHPQPLLQADPQTYDEAKQFCANSGMQLVELTHQAKAAAVRAVCTGAACAWLGLACEFGLCDTDFAGWYWTSGRPVMETYSALLKVWTRALRPPPPLGPFPSAHRQHCVSVRCPQVSRGAVLQRSVACQCGQRPPVRFPGRARWRWRACDNTSAMDPMHDQEVPGLNPRRLRSRPEGAGVCWATPRAPAGA